MTTTKATLKPGQNGTKRLTEKYGSRLVCVRYKYDQTAGKRYVTVELIEEESDWTAPAEASKAAPTTAALSTALDQRVAVRVAYGETELRKKIKAAGGIWRPRHKLWELRRTDAIALGIESRIVGDAPESPGAA